VPSFVPCSLVFRLTRCARMDSAQAASPSSFTSADADEPPHSKTSHSIIYRGDQAHLKAFLAFLGQKDFFHPSIEVKHSPIAGRGLFATDLIREGELISYENPDDYLVLNKEQVESMSVEDQDFWWHFCYQVGDDAWFGPKSREVVARKRTFFTNHSCNPTTWFSDDITMTARRDIFPGEEITYDYSTTESYIDPEMETVICRCNTPVCRGRLYPTDWQRPDLQLRYGPHWMTYLVEKIASHRQALERQSEVNDDDTTDSPRGDRPIAASPTALEGPASLPAARSHDPGCAREKSYADVSG